MILTLQTFIWLDHPLLFALGPVFDAKVRHCSRVVHKYLERAAAPYPDLTDVTTFFNTDTDDSSVHWAACREGAVCIEETIMYSLLGESLALSVCVC